MWPPDESSDQPALQRLAAQSPDGFFRGHPLQFLTADLAVPGDVGSKQDVGAFEQWMGLRQRFLFKNIEPRAGKPAVVQRVREGNGIDKSAPGGIDQQAGGLKCG